MDLRLAPRDPFPCPTPPHPHTHPPTPDALAPGVPPRSPFPGRGSSLRRPAAVRTLRGRPCAPAPVRASAPWSTSTSAPPPSSAPAWSASALRSTKSAPPSPGSPAITTSSSLLSPSSPEESSSSRNVPRPLLRPRNLPAISLPRPRFPLTPSDSRTHPSPWPPPRRDGVWTRCCCSGRS